MKQALASVISNNEVMPGACLIWLESPDIASVAKPGQFVMVHCGEDSVLRRPLSVHRADNDKFALLFKVVGKGTRWLSERQTGETLDIFGPMGNGFSINPSSKKLLLVAGGMGIAPLRFLADEAIKQGKTVTLFMGAASRPYLLPEPTDLTSRGLLTDGVLPWGVTIHKCTDDGSEGYRDVVTHLIIEQYLIEQADQIFACGPLPMYKTMSEMPELKGKRVQISLEVRMGCGSGVCYGCTVRTKKGLRQVCKDGPVFRLDDVIYDELACAL